MQYATSGRLAGYKVEIYARIHQRTGRLERLIQEEAGGSLGHDLAVDDHRGCYQ